MSELLSAEERARLWGTCIKFVGGISKLVMLRADHEALAGIVAAKGCSDLCPAYDAARAALAASTPASEDTRPDERMPTIESLEAEKVLYERALELAERREASLLAEARAWKMEAMTQRATVHEIYQLVSGARGEPGDWNGARPVAEALASLSTDTPERPDTLLGPEWQWCAECCGHFKHGHDCSDTPERSPDE